MNSRQRLMPRSTSPRSLERRRLSPCCCLLSLLGHYSDPIVQYPTNDLVAVAVTARDLARFDPAPLTAPGFLGEIFEEQRVHRALQANMQLADLTFGESKKGYELSPPHATPPI
jgi:hypothetical protein